MFKALIIIPAYNEESNIGKVLAGIRDKNIDADVLVVNDGSIDRTEEIALSENAKVISLPYNLGYGSALQTGFKYAVSKGYDYIIQFDGDGQHDPENIKAIMNELLTGDADIVIGSRFLGNCSLNMGYMKKVAIALFRSLIKKLGKTVITDPTSGLQGLSRNVFKYYSMKGNFPGDYPDADLLIHMTRCKFRVREIPANIRQRDNGRSMHSGLKPIYYFIKVLLSILIFLLREKIAGGGRKVSG
jgi:glycosyltransferase involved in cell wall biosynthesis